MFRNVSFCARFEHLTYLKYFFILKPKLNVNELKIKTLSQIYELNYLAFSRVSVFIVFNFQRTSKALLSSFCTKHVDFKLL